MVQSVSKCYEVCRTLMVYVCMLPCLLLWLCLEWLSSAAYVSLCLWLSRCVYTCLTLWLLDSRSKWIKLRNIGNIGVGICLSSNGACKASIWRFGGKQRRLRRCHIQYVSLAVYLSRCVSYSLCVALAVCLTCCVFHLLCVSHRCVSHLLCAAGAFVTEAGEADQSLD